MDYAVHYKNTNEHLQKILPIVEIETTTRAEAQLMDSTISLDGLVAEWEHQEDGRR